MTEFSVRGRFAGPQVRDPDLDARLTKIVNKALDEPFVGVHAAEAAPSGLFPIRSTGVPTTDLVERARQFLDGLTTYTRQDAILDLGAPDWRMWCNFDSDLFRHGVGLDSMSDTERERALGLVAAALSDTAFAAARDVMRLNGTLGDLTGRPKQFGEWLYWLAIFGEPGAEEPWGFQIDGHHLIVSCFVLGDQLVLSPFFLGSEPVSVESGRHAGTRVLDKEEADGYALIQEMTEEERKAAIIGTDLPHELITAAFKDNVEIGYEGIRGSDLSGAARERLFTLIRRYVERIRPGHAEVKLAEVEAHFDDTWFTWIGGTGPEDVFYYRVQNPVVLIEFDHLPGIVFDNDFATRRHIHTVVRTPNGNDYGKDLLAQHLAAHHRS